MQVDALGYVWLNNGYYSHCWGPRTFPYSYYRSYSRTGHTIAAFWQYQWLTNTSAVYHQVFLRQEKETLFKEIDETIYKQTSQECSSFRFESQWALIVTWEGMRGYGRYHVPWLPDTVSCVCACVCVCVCARVHTCACLYACLYVRISVCMCVCACARKCACV